MLVRDANPADLSRLMELLQASPSAAQWSKKQFAEIIAKPGSRVMLVLECASETPGEATVRIEGFAVGCKMASEAEIENVVIHPGMRRRGLGETLVAELLGRLQRAGCESVFLEVRESNHAARALYEKSGFTVVGRRMNYYAQPTEDAAVYRRSADRLASEKVQD